MICLRDQADHIAANTALMLFAEVFGLEVNRKKTHCARGVSRHDRNTVATIENVKYLGVPIHGVDWSTEYETSTRKPFLHEKMATIALVINVYIFSTICFLDAHDAMPDECISKLMQNVIRRLQGGGIKLSTKVIHTSCRLCGPRLIDLQRP